MDIYHDLIKDHREVQKMLKSMCDEKNRTARSCQRDFMKLWMKLTAHMLAEEKTLYSELLEEDNARADALEAIEEHRVGRAVMREMDKGQAGDERWTAKLKVLRDVLEHHIEEEERQIFKDAKKAFSSEEARDIDRSFREEKKRVMEHRAPVTTAMAR